MDQTGADILKMPKLNIITGCVLTIAGLVVIFWIIPFHIAPQEVDRYVNSPKFFSYVSAVVLTILAILLIIQNVLRIKRLKEVVQEVSEEIEVLGFGWYETINLGILAVGSAAYIFLMDIAGFIIASIVLLAVSMYFARVNIRWLVITSVAIPIFIQQLLWHTLAIGLP